MLEDITPGVTPVNSHGFTSDLKHYFSLSDQIDDGRLDPGESVHVPICFFNPTRVRFYFRLGVRGLLLGVDEEDGWFKLVL